MSFFSTHNNFDAYEINYNLFLNYLSGEKLIFNREKPLIITMPGKISGQFRNYEGAVVNFTTQIPPIHDDGRLFYITGGERGRL